MLSSIKKSSALLSLAAITSAVFAKCPLDRTINIPMPNWPSAITFAHIAKAVMEANDCSVEQLTGSSAMFLTGLEKGSLDVGMEMWVPNILEIFNRNIYSGNWIPLGKVTDPAVQGVFVPSYVKEKFPDLNTVKDLIKYKDEFKDPEQPSKGRYYPGITGWYSTITESNRAKSYLGDHFTRYEVGDPSAIEADLKKNTRLKRPMALYWWSPDLMIAKYNLVQLKENTPHNAETWPCLSDPECPNPQASAWPDSPIVKVVTNKFFHEAPSLAAQIGNIYLSHEELLKVMKIGDENNGDYAKAVQIFFKDRPEIWKKWQLPKAVEERLASQQN